MSSVRRCAIYTRKSSEEGLDQSFNSLDAQAEACRAYVLSQAGEGWTALPTAYDDGGYSGGSIVRPGIKALMVDIERGLIDVVVVYKVDRLTRSLADFARLVELFDHHNVSFVSVTQAFNTTTSMGRLTLNVLLSFAQFEREVTGERIRDKIAQSKAKGMWMGGRIPLGYDVADHKLVVNAAEADCVRDLFQRYLELGSVPALAVDLHARGIRSKRWANKRGDVVGGAPFGRGQLYYLLTNPIYRGVIRHRDLHYENAHPAIIDEALWAGVQQQLSGGAPARPKPLRLNADVLLRDRLFDDRGQPMRPLHTKRGSKRYRYYASVGLVRGSSGSHGSLPRIAMGILDAFVIDQSGPLLAAGWRPDAALQARVREALMSVTLGADRVVIILRSEAVVADPHGAGGAISVTDAGLELAVGIRLKHRQGALLIAAPNAAADVERIDRALVRAVCLAHRWSVMLAQGVVGSTKELARTAGYCEHYAARMLPLAWLAPDLVADILEGRQPRALSLGTLMKHPLPLDWDEQRRLFAAIG